jgi:hypothetical protein
MFYCFDISLIVIAVTTAVALLKVFGPSWTNDHSDDERITKTVPAPTVRPRGRVVQKKKPIDDHASDFDGISRNIVNVGVTTSGKSKYGVGTFSKANCIIINRHLLLSDGTDYLTPESIRVNDHTYPVRSLYISEYEWAILLLSVQVQGIRSILHRFTEKMPTPFSGSFNALTPDDETLEVRHQENLEYSYHPISTPHGTDYEVLHFITSGSQMTNGNSGTPLVSASLKSAHNGRIVGIYRGSYGHRSAFSPVTRECLVAAYEAFSLPPVEIGVEDANIQEHSLDFLGPHKSNKPLPSETDYVRTAMFEKLGVPNTTFPPCLTQLDGKPSPLRNVVAQHKRNPHSEVSQASIDLASQLFRDTLPHIEPRVLSVHQAFQNLEVPDEKVGTAFKSSASAGAYLPGTKGAYIDVRVGENYPKHPLLLRINQMLLSLQNEDPSIWPESFAWACMKDALVSESKIYNPRLFYACDFSEIVLQKMFFFAFLTAYRDDPIGGDSSIGINYHSPEWKYLYHRLETATRNLGDGDYPKFDKNLSPVHGDAIAQIISDVTRELFPEFVDVSSYTLENGVYMPCSFRIRPVYAIEFLLKGATRSPFIVDRFLVKPVYVNLSGSFLVWLINTWHNKYHFCHWYATTSLSYRDAAPTLDPYLWNLVVTPTAFNFRMLFKLSFHGDDFVVAFLRGTESIFDIVKFAAYLNTVGLGLTPAQKSSQLAPFVPVSELQYLKRRFVAEPTGSVVAPLDYNSILETLYWKKESSGLSDRAFFLINYPGTLLELAHHSHSVFLKGRSTLQNCYKRVFHSDLDSDCLLANPKKKPLLDFVLIRSEHQL